MKRFLIRLSLLLLVPLFGLAIVYLICDPYKTLKPFSLEYFDTSNRDYLSSELFLMNYPEQHYNAFVFASSRGCGINTYHWKKYLPEDAHPFLFQAWSETLTGIEQKILYLSEHSMPIDYALILIDIPGTIIGNPKPTEAIAIKDPKISGQPSWMHQLILFNDFIQKPSQWIKAIHNQIHLTPPDVSFDTITNDWDRDNQFIDLAIPPAKDSLKNMSQLSRTAFLKEIQEKTDEDLITSEPLIDSSVTKQLHHIRSVFDMTGTEFKIIITPAYCYTSPAISEKDLHALKAIFGSENVFNYTGKIFLTNDYNNFSDPNHFGQFVGWHIIEDIYNSDSLWNKMTTN